MHGARPRKYAHYPHCTRKPFLVRISAELGLDTHARPDGRECALGHVCHEGMAWLQTLAVCVRALHRSEGALATQVCRAIGHCARPLTAPPRHRPQRLRFRLAFAALLLFTHRRAAAAAAAVVVGAAHFQLTDRVDSDSHGCEVLLRELLSVHRTSLAPLEPPGDALIAESMARLATLGLDEHVLTDNAEKVRFHLD